MIPIKAVTSKENPLYKFIKSLNQKKVRESKKLFLVEGIRLTEEAVKSGVKIKYLIINEAVKNFPQVNNDCCLLRLKNSLFKSLSNTINPQGIIAVAEYMEISLDDITLDANPFIVVLNGIQDPGNAGTIIRTAAAAGTSAVFLTKGTVELYNPKVIRATMGSLFQVSIVNDLDDKRTVKWLKDHVINILVADLSGQEYYYSTNLKEPLALVIGNENKGPDDIWKKSADKKIKIPILGRTESLNASVAAGVLIYEVIRQRSI